MQSTSFLDYRLYQVSPTFTHNPSFAVRFEDAAYPTYLYRFHYANGCLMQIGGIMMVVTAGEELDSRIGAMMKELVDRTPRHERTEFI